MPTDTERRLEHLENLLLFGGGVTAGTASGRKLARAAARGTGRQALSLAGTGGRMAMLAARAHPVGAAVTTAATLAYLGYIHRDDIMDVAEALGEAEIPSVKIPGVRGGATTAFKKRALSKANRAVKFAMGDLKAGTKASTGADKGKLPKGAWSLSTKAAGLANPNTPSKIGRGKSKVNRLARKIKKWWK